MSLGLFGPSLKATHDAFGRDDRFVMIGLSLDRDVEAPGKYAAEHGLDWVQGFLGQDPPGPVTADFGVQGLPQTMLIGPDGKVLARDLRGDRIKEAVARALATPP